MRAHHSLVATMVTVLLASACSKQKAAEPAAPAVPAPELAPEETTYRPSTPVPTHPGFFLPGSQDLDACAVVTPADLQPVFGKVIAKGSSAVAGMSTCAFEREGSPDIDVTIFTTAGLHSSAAEHFAKQTKSIPKAALTEIAGAGDGAVFIAMMSMLSVRKGDVIVQLMAQKPEGAEGLPEAQARKLATIVAAKLAQLPAGTGQERKAAPVANAATLGSFDVCGLVIDTEAAAIFGGKVQGNSVRGRDGTQSLDSCIYENRTSGAQLLSVIAWTPAALKKAGHGTAAEWYAGLIGSPMFGGQKVAGLGDEATRGKEMMVVLGKNTVLQLNSRQPEDKLKAFAKIALSRL